MPDALRRAALVCVYLMAISAPAAAQFGPAPVSVAPVVEREIAAGQTFVGTVRPVRRSTIGSAVDGRVIEVMVEEGDQPV